ncbi:type II toxin-antitoxin system VapC family toxin [Sandaracinobacter neustonicus]|uniref:Ribonuclease VapC n=1 Tax=Sandaracinobacter neustonicus TaxID=1715348 RepID=A0A501XDE6_9SPHN|nr:type II toxin-antitoxin system VapC family toxin [Sandaracinobacter neustonicus]TPE58610.1 type II toxin-antitoxin system VapC family toxin [Sandaracinobacter neustonicus]
MIAVDSSILVGRMRGEADVLAIRLPTELCLSSTTAVESAAWCARNLPGGRSDWLEAFLADGRVRIDAFSPAMVEIASEALRSMGRGTGHPAQLNFGDAMVYAHALLLGLPLLCKGDDFRHTDLQLDPRSILTG